MQNVLFFVLFWMQKDRAFQKWPQNYSTCLSLQSGANFPEIAIGYGSPGINIYIPGAQEFVLSCLFLLLLRGEVTIFRDIDKYNTNTLIYVL